MSHPAHHRLEALAAGDADPGALTHLEDCAACTEVVRELRAEVEAFRREADPAAFVDAVLARAEPTAALPEVPAAATLAAPPRNVAFLRFVTVAAPLFAVAAAIVLYLRAPSTITTAPGPGTEPSTSDVRFKGGLQLAVVREREGAQARFSGEVPVRAGDRIRAEIAIDGQVPLTAVLLKDGASSDASGASGASGNWVLLTPTLLDAGVHFSPESIRFDQERFDGWLVVGEPDKVAAARKSRRWDEVRVMRIRFE